MSLKETTVKGDQDDEKNKNKISFFTLKTAVKQLDEELKAQKSQIQELKDKISELKAQNRELKKLYDDERRRNLERQDSVENVKLEQELRETVKSLYEVKKQDLYRSFFSTNHFMGDLQQMFGFARKLRNEVSTVTETDYQRFVLIFCNGVVNDLQILRGNLERYEAAEEEEVEQQLRLLLASDRKPTVTDRRKLVATQKKNLKHAQEEPNWILYGQMWQELQPLLPCFDERYLELLLKVGKEARDPILQLTDELEQLLKRQGVDVYYSEEELPPELRNLDLLLHREDQKRCLPLIIRSRDQFVYARGVIGM